MDLLARLLPPRPIFRAGRVVVRERDGVRTLHLGSRTIQSAMRISDPDGLELAYTRAMMGYLLFRPPPARVLLLGLGGGSLAKFHLRRFADVRVHVVELYADVVAAARSHFALPVDERRLTIDVGDGARYVREAAAPADVIMVDAFDGLQAAPGLRTFGFYTDCRRLLGQAGVLVVNLWANARDLDATLRRVEAVFDGRCLRLPAERPGNIAVFAFADSPELAWAALRARAAQGRSTWHLPVDRFLADLRAMNAHDAAGLRFGGRDAAQPAGEGRLPPLPEL